MPIIHSYTIRNFKGIEETKIELLGKTRVPLTTLIGLNESGKTTILEALSQWVSEDKSVSGLFAGSYPQGSRTGLIPIHKKAAFSSTIDVAAVVQLDQGDIDRIEAIVNKHNACLDRRAIATPFQIISSMEFEDSVYKSMNSFWQFNLKVCKRRSSKYTALNNKSEIWQEVQQQIAADLPQIAYFPTFLVNMPSKIYLREYDKETALNRYYRQVLQDVLNSLAEGLTLEKHVCARIDDYRHQDGTAVWFSNFYSSHNRALVDSVFQKISHTVTKQVLGSWHKVFQRPISAKNIIVEWNIDTQRENVPYAAFYITDGESKYAIHERSLGFRWFFSFLLFTAFKQAKARNTIFVFDEPAANLHARAQAELLTSFSKIASEGNRIIYSTHSHHMINPQWLAGAYIIENTALDYDNANNFALTSKPTNIKATKYKDFVSQHPTRSSYFQPVIERLQYSTPALLGTAPFVIVEGISDYYALKLAATLSRTKLLFSFMPGSGAGASAPLISLLLARGERFFILLDDDKAGQKELQRYQKEWFLPKETAFTLGQVSTSYTGKQIEGLLCEETLALIAQRYGIEETPTKKQIALYLSEMCALQHKSSPIGKTSLDNLAAVLAHLNERVEQTNAAAVVV